ncbi:MAG: hypothetical protein JWO58_2835 [Chitinophagaceae bacterium]|nr:hypothetical protein [Chitinophagaceae bacterium]
MEVKIIHKTFSFLVDQDQTTYNKKFDLDKNVRVVLGLVLSSDDPRQLYFRGSQRLEINGDEIYPEDYESKLLMSGISVPPNEKYLDLGNGVIAGNGEIKMLFKDSANINSAFSSYKVILTIKCELK